LPYKIQEIISENFKATFEQLHPEFLTRQKDYEYLRQKDQNRIIMQDTGISSLEKRGYVAPG
jgi:hypothetical protein